MPTVNCFTALANSAAETGSLPMRTTSRRMAVCASENLPPSHTPLTPNSPLKPGV